MSLKLVGANPKAHAEGLDQQMGRSNYFLGNKSNQWLTGVPQFARVEYHDVYPGIDMAYYGTNERLEYDFILGPHADPRRIRLAVDGADRIRIDSEGDLVLTVGPAEIRERKPLICQKTANGEKIVRGRYAALGGNQIGFVLEKYDQSKALVIDPALVFSTYFGGSGADYGNGIAVDSEGNSYIAGQTGSANLSGTDIGDPGFTGSYTAAFVAKISPSGALLSTTIVAGANDAAEAGAVALDTNGNIYL
ncbi:MAG: SBBP repeat-containing protein, partial [Terracidiphilus sp.]